MTYVTQAGLVSLYGAGQLIALTDRDGAGEINADVLDAAIAGVGGEIDGYLTGRYTLPLAEVPPILTRIAARLVISDLHTLDKPDTVKDEAKWARDALKDIASGRLRLDDGDGDGAAPEQIGASPTAIGRMPTFADGGLADFTDPRPFGGH